MRVGPSKSACRSRLQTTLSCCGKEPWWWALRKRPGRDRVRYGSWRRVTPNHWWGVEKTRWRQNWDLFPSQDKFGGSLFIARAASGIKVAWTWSWLSCGTWEPVVPMLREKSKWRTHEDESTDAEHRGGTARSSEEASVMEVERRCCVIQFWKLVNQKWEEPMDQTKPLAVCWMMGAGWAERFMSGSERAWRWDSSGLLTSWLCI